jgi:tetratricopeptide (TPR) repeat protein
MSIKNLIKISFYLLIIFSFRFSVSAREPYDWSYNFERGRKQYSAKMYNDALVSLKLSLKKNPQSFESANIIAVIYLMKKDFYSAEKYFLMSLEVNDTQPETHIYMGEIDEYFQRDESAMNHYKKSVSLNTDNPKALINLARMYYKKGELSEFEKYFKLSYDKGITQSSSIVIKAAEMKKDNPVEAAEEFKKAIILNPAHIEAYIGLADSYRQIRLYDNAAEVLENLKKIKPDYALTYIYLGNIYYNNKPEMKTRKYFISMAIRNYEKAITLDPGNPDIYFQLADIYKLIKNRDRATELELKGSELLNKSK